MTRRHGGLPAVRFGARFADTAVDLPILGKRSMAVMNHQRPQLARFFWFGLIALLLATLPGSAVAAPTWSSGTVSLNTSGTLAAHASCSMSYAVKSGQYNDTFTCKVTDDKKDNRGVRLKVSWTGGSSWGTLGNCDRSDSSGSSNTCVMDLTNAPRKYTVKMSLCLLNGSTVIAEACTTKTFEGIPSR